MTAVAAPAAANLAVGSRRARGTQPRRHRRERKLWAIEAEVQRIARTVDGVTGDPMLTRYLTTHPEREIANNAGWCAACGYHVSRERVGWWAHRHNAVRHPRRYAREGLAL